MGCSLGCPDYNIENNIPEPSVCFLEAASCKGLKFSYINEFIETICGGRFVMEGMSMEDVVNVVKKYTESSKKSLVDHIASVGEGRSDVIGKATWFVSYRHAMDCPFLEVADAIVHFFERRLKEDPNDSPTLWIDIFSISQHIAGKPKSLSRT
jgi:hypothetical protein